MRGGQDFELGGLMVLTLLCLALVLPRHCKQYVQALFVRSGYDFRNLIRTALREIFATTESLPPCIKPAPTSGVYDIPLQI